MIEFLIRKSEGKRRPRKYTPRLEDNINMYLRK
jgi:hypothetical protein